MYMSYLLDVQREGKEQELSALLQSGVVRDKTQLHSLLGYLGVKALQEPGEALKEHRIGVEALHKPPDYDPRTDPTVRVEVAKLRKKLEEFYHGPGAAHPVQMVIPKGSYLPVFVPATARAVARRRLPWLPWALVVLMAIAAILAWATGRRKPAPLASELSAFWAPHFRTATPTLLVYGTPVFLKMQGRYFRDPHVNRPEEFQAHDETQKILHLLKPRETRPVFTFTGVGEAEALFHLARLLTAGGASLMVQASNAVGWEDLKGKHAVLLGGRKFNQQIPDLPFKPRFEAVSRRIVNLAPKPGEPGEYRTASLTSHGEITEEYALISVYPGLSQHTRLMTLECSSTEGTLAAAEFVTRPDTIRQLIAHGVRLDATAFQIVIGAKLNHGVVVSLFYRNHRTL